MNGPHDMGGLDGFGPVQPDGETGLFHAGWERRMMAMMVAAGAMGHWSIDEMRSAREDRSPAEYYSVGYYHLWLLGLERMLVEKGLLDPTEITGGPIVEGTVAPRRVLRAEDVSGVLARGAPAERSSAEAAPPKFGPGDAVRMRNLQPRGHCRLPAYARGKPGRVEAVQGYHLYADASAQGEGDVAHWLYTISFDAVDLWGARGVKGDSVTIDAWEPYIDPA
ncbi:nitrile hydratase subunit beta [Pseudooceanicola sp. C21-150M6]|uniref:nitrile hydratase subunit beta n=1 Tax=Pseudooceanicola sp. C21-150M6 TaxID=3434355 RepID=UPI003D7FEFAB